VIAATALIKDATTDLAELRDLLSDLHYESENQGEPLFKRAALTMEWLLAEYLEYRGPLQTRDTGA
jgi:hypothetical protein